MEVILIKDVPNLGLKNDVVTVKNGYGENYLIPQGYAILATESAKKVHAENLKQRAHKESKLDNSWVDRIGFKTFQSKCSNKSILFHMVNY